MTDLESIAQAMWRAHGQFVRDLDGDELAGWLNSLMRQALESSSADREWLADAAENRLEFIRFARTNAQQPDLVADLIRVVLAAAEAASE